MNFPTNNLECTYSTLHPTLYKHWGFTYNTCKSGNAMNNYFLFVVHRQCYNMTSLAGVPWSFRFETNSFRNILLCNHCDCCGKEEYQIRLRFVRTKVQKIWSVLSQKEIPVKIFLLEILFPVRPTGFWPLEPVDFQLVTQVPNWWNSTGITPVEINGNHSC